MAIDLESMRVRLTQRREELTGLNTLSAESRDAVELDQARVGRLSRIDALQQQEMAKASEQHRLRELARIDAALRRIADGAYGYCIECDEEIAPKRLEADPAAALCIDCAGTR